MSPVEKKVFVTGASSGIGKKIAELFSRSGATVFGTSFSGNQISKACSKWIKADFANVDQILRVSEEIIALKPDILINNAGINKIDCFRDINHEDFQKIYNINTLAPFMFCQAALTHMKQQQWGRIVNVASIWSKVSIEKRASYSASKFALDGLTVSLALEHGKDGVLANCVSPGFVDTDLTKKILGEAGVSELLKKVPMGRLAYPEEIAELVLWLSSEQNTFLTAQNISIDGGFTRG